jgi:AraC-like DNA-binding protein
MWEIVFIRSGRVEVTENEKIYQLEKNNMIIHAPWEFHRIKSIDGTSPTLYVMSFFAEGRLPAKLNEGVFVLNTEQALQYSSIFERIDSFLNSEKASSYAGQNAADGLSAFLIEMSGENVTTFSDTSATATEYRKLVLVMSSAVCDNKNISDFARECGDSVSYIKQLFKKYAGISPKAYYNNLRINYASKLLNEGKSVKEIAEQMNFSSSNYLSAFFKKNTGKTPLSCKNANN